MSVNQEQLISLENFDENVDYYPFLNRYIDYLLTYIKLY